MTLETLSRTYGGIPMVWVYCEWCGTPFQTELPGIEVYHSEHCANIAEYCRENNL